MPGKSRVSSDAAKGNFTDEAQKKDGLMEKDTTPLLIDPRLNISFL